MTDKILHNLNLPCTACLESAGVVENISIMVCEHELVLDVMLATLYKQEPHDQPFPIMISLANLYRRVELINLERW